MHGWAVAVAVAVGVVTPQILLVVLAVLGTFPGVLEAVVLTALLAVEVLVVTGTLTI
jgi:hypothetical protein